MRGARVHAPFARHPTRCRPALRPPRQAEFLAAVDALDFQMRKKNSDKAAAALANAQSKLDAVIAKLA